jgi:putative solute:sodium symporter small subunit
VSPSDGTGEGRAAARSGRRATALDRYWRSNLQWMLALLLVWALVGPGLSILFVETLNQFRLGGFPLGFWFAQQGSILVFVLLIGVYAVVMNRLDERHRRDRAEEESG